MKNSALEYARGIERRHNMSAEVRSLGKHCELPSAGDMGLSRTKGTNVGVTDVGSAKGMSPGKGAGKLLVK